LPWSLVEEGIGLLESKADLGEGIDPCFRHGDFGLEHCEGGDPAFEMKWFGNHSGEGWWDKFTGETSPVFPTQTLLEGYQEVVTVDGTFQERSAWLTFCSQLGGLCYHGVHDIDTAGMKEFLNWRYREDLGNARKDLG
jgi:hypothetical protein